MVTEAQARAKANYRKKTKQISIEFNESEMELYNFIVKQGNKQGFIKKLIKKEMEKSI